RQGAQAVGDVIGSGHGSRVWICPEQVGVRGVAGIPQVCAVKSYAHPYAGLAPWLNWTVPTRSLRALGLFLLGVIPADAVLATMFARTSTARRISPATRVVILLR